MELVPDALTAALIINPAMLVLPVPDAAMSAMPMLPESSMPLVLRAIYTYHRAEIFDYVLKYGSSLTSIHYEKGVHEIEGKLAYGGHRQTLY